MASDPVICAGFRSSARTDSSLFVGGCPKTHPASSLVATSRSQQNSPGPFPARSAASGRVMPSAHRSSSAGTWDSVMRGHTSARCANHSFSSLSRTAGSVSASSVASRSAIGSQPGSVTSVSVLDPRRYG